MCKRPTVQERPIIVLFTIFGNTYQISLSTNSSVASKIKSHSHGMAQEIKSHCGTGFPLNKFDMVQTATTIHIKSSTELTISLERQYKTLPLHQFHNLLHGTQFQHIIPQYD